MNPFPHDSVFGEPTSFEETLRLIAHAPVPEGLAERVQSGLDAHLKAAPRVGRLLTWPAALCLSSNWMRTAAAAAIVCMVVGGGWGVVSRVRPGSAARVAAPLPHVAAPGGFSNLGAMRTPQTLNGPVLTHSVPQSQPANPTAKPTLQSAPKQPRHAKPGSANKAALQPATPAAK